MGIEKQTMYTVKCDNCGEYYTTDDIMPVFGDESEADNSVRNDGEWIKEEGLYFCPDCYEYDEGDHLVIKPVVISEEAYLCVNCKKMSHVKPCQAHGNVLGYCEHCVHPIWSDEKK